MSKGSRRTGGKPLRPVGVDPQARAADQASAPTVSAQTADDVAMPSPAEHSLSVDRASATADVEHHFYRTGLEVENAPHDSPHAHVWAPPLHDRAARGGHRAAAVVGVVGALLLVSLGFWQFRNTSAPKPVVSAAAAPPAPATVTEPVAPVVAQSPAATASATVCHGAYDEGKLDDAVELCKQALTAQPESADLAVMVARAEFDRGRTSEADVWARRALAIDPATADAYVFVGSAQQEAGRSSEARAAYQKYLELAPQGRYAAELRNVMGSL